MESSIGRPKERGAFAVFTERSNPRSSSMGLKEEKLFSQENRAKHAIPARLVTILLTLKSQITTP